MSLRCGIVGLPNVGKSTIFNAITRAGAQSANYPFCTVEPNVGRVDVPDERLTKLADLIKPQSVVAAYTEFVDIAGLVEGASQGEGLGNKFLSHIRETQAIAHVVRCFEDDNIVHVRGEVSPLDDIRIINLELILADMESLGKQINSLEKKARSGDKESRADLEVAQLAQKHLEEELPLRTLELDENQSHILKKFHLITARPALYVANVAEEDAVNGNEQSKKVAEYAASEKAPLVIISGAIEEELSGLSEEESSEYLQSLGLEEPGLNRMIRASYSLLDLITFFTAGEQEVRAWTIRRNSNAAQAAGTIHSDMERGFIRAEVVSYQDTITCGSLSAARDAGKMRLEGRDYIVADGDVCYFRFNV